VRVEWVRSVLTGVATGLGPAGELIVRGDDGRETTVRAADVVHLRATGGHDPRGAGEER
jgi:hypothetical protein